LRHSPRIFFDEFVNSEWLRDIKSQLIEVYEFLSRQIKARYTLECRQILFLKRINTAQAQDNGDIKLFA